MGKGEGTGEGWGGGEGSGELGEANGNGNWKYGLCGSCSPCSTCKIYYNYRQSIFRIPLHFYALRFTFSDSKVLLNV